MAEQTGSRVRRNDGFSQRDLHSGERSTHPTNITKTLAHQSSRRPIVPETVTCTECGAKLKVAALPPPGKKMRCPKCQAAFLPEQPLPDEDEEEEGLSAKSAGQL